MTRKLGDKPAVQRTYQLPYDLVKRLDAYCEHTGIARNFVITKALTSYLDKAEVDSGMKEGI